MREEPLVSVVVPVFNAQPHLEECLNSLRRQTLRPLEVIAVDDGSTDGSGATLHEMAAEDWLRVLTHAANRGVSAARNTGLAAARGTYVAFVDADDVVAPNMYAALIEAARIHDADIAMCGIQMVDAAGREGETVRPPFQAGARHGRTAMREALQDAWAGRLLWYPFRSIYSRHLLLTHHVAFDPEIRKGEDSLFNLEALLLAEGVTAVDSGLYSYRKHPFSATAKPLPSESTNLEHLSKAVLGLYAQYGFGEQARRDFYRHVLRSDLPTALVRVTNHEAPRREATALVSAAPVRCAFRSERLSQLGVPMPVAALLILAKYRLTGPLVVALRVSRALRARRSP